MSSAIEYRLTTLGDGLYPVLASLIEWGVHHAEALDEAGKLLTCHAVVQDRTT